MTFGQLFGGYFLGAVSTVVAIQYATGRWPFDDKDDANNGESEPLLKGQKARGGSGSKEGNLRGSSQGVSGNELTSSSGSAYARAKLAADGITGEGFLCDIVAHLWPNMSAAIAACIKEIVEPMFAELLPGPLRTLRFTKIDFGTCPIRLTNVVVHTPKEGTVQFDVDVVWPESNCDIDLAVDIPAMGTVRLGVEDVHLTGRMSIWLSPLMPVLPVVSAVQYAFINPPKLDLKFTGLAQVANLSVVENIIHKILDDILAGLMVLPRRMMIKLDPANDYFKTYLPPVGIVRVKVVRGRGFRVEKTVLGGSDIPDCYCNIKFGSHPKIWRTSTIHDNTEPEWNEHADFVLSDHGQELTVDAFDHDAGPMDSDDPLGSATISIGDLLVSEGRTKEVELVHGDGKRTGSFLTVSGDVHPLSPDDISSFDSPARQQENTLCGLLTILVPKAMNVPFETKEEALLGSFVKVTYGEDEDALVFQTGAIVECPGIDHKNPTYDAYFHVPLTAGMIAQAGTPAGTVTLSLMIGEKVLGETTITHGSLSRSPSKSITERRSIGDGGASVEFRMFLCGVVDALDTGAIALHASSSGNSAKNTIANLGIVNFRVLKGRGFKVEKKKLKKDDIPDCYAVVNFGATEWRTSVVKDSTTPEWNESSKFPVTGGMSQAIKIHVWDEDKKNDDDLGTAKITVGQLLMKEGPLEVELMMGARGTGSFITVECTKVDGEGPTIETTATTPEDPMPLSKPSDVEDDGIVIVGDLNQELSAPPTDSMNAAAATPDLTPASSAQESTPEKIKTDSTSIVKITAINGRGFKPEKRHFRKDDIPDVYCKIRVGEHPQVFRTSTIKDDLSPHWNESSNFPVASTLGETIYVDVYDEDGGKDDPDDYLGSCTLTVGELVAAAKGTKEMELVIKSKKSGKEKSSGAYITLQAGKVA